jgi:hypothetical protein
MTTPAERKIQVTANKSTKRKFDDVILQKNFMDEMLYHSTNLFWLKYQSGLICHKVVDDQNSWKIEIPFATGHSFMAHGAKRSALIKSVVDNCPYDLSGWKIEFEPKVPTVLTLIPTNKQKHPPELDTKQSTLSTLMSANKREYLLNRNSSNELVEDEKTE